MEIKSVLSGEKFESLIRGVGLIYNPDLRPYNSAEISVRSLEIASLSPLAKYVLEDNLTQLKKIREDLLAHGVDIFQLSGRIEAISGLDPIFVAPPVVEEWPHEGSLIVDGLHRLWLARLYGIKDVTCVFIRRASMPLVPLPVRWSEIQVYPAGSPPIEKRTYRFNKPSDIAVGNQAIEWGVTDQNFRYFFFRNFSPLGSSGIRQFPKTKEHKEQEEVP